MWRTLTTEQAWTLIVCAAVFGLLLLFFGLLWRAAMARRGLLRAMAALAGLQATLALWVYLDGPLAPPLLYSSQYAVGIVDTLLVLVALVWIWQLVVGTMATMTPAVRAAPASGRTGSSGTTRTQPASPPRTTLRAAAGSGRHQTGAAAPAATPTTGPDPK